VGGRGSRAEAGTCAGTGGLRVGHWVWGSVPKLSLLEISSLPHGHHLPTETPVPLWQRVSGCPQPPDTLPATRAPPKFAPPSFIYDFHSTFC